MLNNVHLLDVSYVTTYISLQCRCYVGAEYGTLDESVRCRHLGL